MTQAMQPFPDFDGGASSPVCTRRLEAWLSQICGFEVGLVWHRNRRTMLSWGTVRARSKRVMRAHRAFAEADESVWLAAVLFLTDRGTPQTRTHLQRFIDSIEVMSSFKETETQSLVKMQRGAVHDLGPMYRRLNMHYFHNQCSAVPRWGKHANRSRRQKTLGSFDPSTHRILIDRCLDQHFVPAVYVEWVLFHEMLHEVYGADYCRGRREVHPPAFKALESTFHAYDACVAWERRYAHRLR